MTREYRETCEFCELPSYIFGNIIEEVNKNFDYKRLKDVIEKTDSTKYNLVITGSIGAGKSTISQILTIILKNYYQTVYAYPEYITINFNNKPIGQDIFEMFMNQKISASTFQNYVIDIWKLMFIENNYREHTRDLTINIFERLPHDAVFCFSREQVGKSMTEAEFQTIVDKYNDLVTNIGIPTYENCSLSKVSNDLQISKTIIEILNIIQNDLIHDRNITRVIGLTISEDKYKQRIVKRGRESEEKYDNSTLLHYNEYYKKLYSEIESRTIVETVDVRRTNSALL